jgi:hypothetical protein
MKTLDMGCGTAFSYSCRNERRQPIDAIDIDNGVI